MSEQATYYFAIVASNDNPIYELEWTPASASSLQVGPSTTFSGGKTTMGSKFDENNAAHHLNQFIVHSALDVVDELQWANLNQQNPVGQTYLKVVDRFNDWLISGYILPSNIRFMLLHDSRNDDGIKTFFQDCHELVIKAMLSPFQQRNEPIRSPQFDARVKIAASRLR